MTEADDKQDGIEGAPADAEGGLWSDVRQWVDAILALFGDLKELAHVGVTRSLGVKLCNWLWGVEGAVRRLILAEALKLDPATLGETRTRTVAPPEKMARRPARRRPCFRIFGFTRQDDAEAPQLSVDSGPVQAGRLAYWHIRFPADPLLSIGGRPIRKTKASAAIRRTNPLDRRGLSRSDPDYWLWREEEDYDAALLGLSPRRSSGRPSHPRPEPVLVHDKPGYLAPNSECFDWKRIEEEWKRVIPAPHLAARIFAVTGILERCDGAARRIARLFQKSRERVVDILGQPAPELAWPRHARSIYRCREVEALVPRSHACLRRLDTS